MSSARQPPPPSEEIHLPGPTILPFACALGITLLVVGTTVSFFFLIAGAILFIVTVVIWIRDTRRDIDELPEEHH